MTARTRSRRRRGDRGFTLIELLVVMIIIGVLAAVAIPVFLNQKKKASDASIKSDLVSVAQQVESSAADTGDYPANTANGSVQRWDVVGGGLATRILPAVRVSPGDQIEYRLKADGTAFCLRGFNYKGTAVGYGGFYWYVSDAGGLQPGPPTDINHPPAGCPSSG